MDQTAQIIIAVNLINSNPIAVFRLTGDNGIQVRNVSIDGGIIEESHNDSTFPLRNWTAIKLEGIDSGVLFNKFTNIQITDAGIGIELVADGNKGGWINSNLFQFLKINYNKNETDYTKNAFIKFEMNGPYTFPPTLPHNLTGIHKNHFENFECECNTDDSSDPQKGIPQKGIIGIKHFGNFFFDVKIWDFKGTEISEVSADARDTIILGGTITKSESGSIVMPTPDNTNTLIIDPTFSKLDPLVNPKLLDIQKDRGLYYTVS